MRKSNDMQVAFGFFSKTEPNDDAKAKLGPSKFRVRVRAFLGSRS